MQVEREKIKSIYDCLSEKKLQVISTDEKPEETCHSTVLSECKENENCAQPSNLKCCNIQEVLKKFVYEYNSPYSQIDFLLKELKYLGAQFPTSNKTLLKNNYDNKVKINKFDPQNSANTAKIAYFGIEKQLQKFLKPNYTKTKL